MYSLICETKADFMEGCANYCIYRNGTKANPTGDAHAYFTDISKEGVLTLQSCEGAQPPRQLETLRHGSYTRRADTAQAECYCES